MIRVSDNQCYLPIGYRAYRPDDSYPIGQNSYPLNVILPCMGTSHNHTAEQHSEADAKAKAFCVLRDHAGVVDILDWYFAPFDDNGMAANAPGGWI